MRKALPLAERARAVADLARGLQAVATMKHDSKLRRDLLALLRRLTDELAVLCEVK